MRYTLLAFHARSSALLAAAPAIRSTMINASNDKPLSRRCRPTWWLLPLFAVSIACGGCRAEQSKDSAEPAGAASHEDNTPEAPPVQPSPVHASGASHDPASPPIDCPLRKQGIDPLHLRPFAEIDDYIAFLEREDRAAWQKPDEIIAALALKGDEIIVDIGAGSGYFTFRFAQAVPRGKVIAADTEAEMVRHIHHRVLTEAIPNIEAKLIQSDDPTLSSHADLVFICDVLHHVVDRPRWLATLVDSMPSGARLAIIEFREGDLPEGPPEALKIPRDQVLDLATKAGLSLVAEWPELLPYQSFLVFQKARSPARP